MSRKTLGIVGIVLIVVGALALLSEGIPYTSQETVMDMGPVTVKADTERKLSLPPVVGGVALVGGIVLLVSSRKRT